MRDQVWLVPGMASRQCARVISGWVSDVTGVVAVEVDLDACALHVWGGATPALVEAAIRAAGYEPRIGSLGGAATPFPSQPAS